MNWVMISRRQHDHSRVIANVYRGVEAGQEFYSYDFSGTGTDPRAALITLRSGTPEMAQDLADELVVREFKRLGIAHNCAPDQCGAWEQIKADQST